MAVDQVIGPYSPFDYGASVRWRQNSGAVIEGSICGFREIGTGTKAKNTEFSAGTVLVLVETQVGESIEIPIGELELI